HPTIFTHMPAQRADPASLGLGHDQLPFGIAEGDVASKVHTSVTPVALSDGRRNGMRRWDCAHKYRNAVRALFALEPCRLNSRPKPRRCPDGDCARRKDRNAALALFAPHRVA